MNPASRAAASGAHTVAVVATHGVIPFDLGIACEVFGRLLLPDGSPAYRVLVCGESATVRAGLLDLRTRWDLSALANAQTVVVPGIDDVRARPSVELVRALRAAAERGARIASICTGAFVLAETGLLDGTRATTHWLAAPALAARYPLVEVDPAVLYVDNGAIVTSAGAAAGLDMCLHLVRRDYGAALARIAARVSVSPLERAGGQAQFILHEPPSSETTLAPLLQWMRENPAEVMTIESLASRAALSTRTFCRRFRDQVGMAPGHWVQQMRIRHAQSLLESTDLPVERVAAASGFDSAGAFRERFRAVVRTSPAAYRRAYQGKGGAWS